MKNIFTLLFTIVASVSMLADVSVSDKTVLLKIYKSTNGENWKTKWDLNAPVSSWYGVKVSGDKVVAINLSDNNLSGEIPSEIADLVSLQELNLHKNKIAGTIPAAIENLKELRVLDLSFNQLTGVIPSAIGEMTNLKDLELYMNRISGQLPISIGKLQNIETLALFNNDLEGQIPNELFEAATLKIVKCRCFEIKQT